MLFCLDLKSVSGRNFAIYRTSFGTQCSSRYIVTPAVYPHLVLNYDIQPTNLESQNQAWVMIGHTNKQTEIIKIYRDTV